MDECALLPSKVNCSSEKVVSSNPKETMVTGQVLLSGHKFLDFSGDLNLCDPTNTERAVYDYPAVSDL